MSGRFEGKVVLITGATGGIGSATAQAFANEGAVLALSDLDGDKLTALADSLSTAGRRPLALPADITSEDEVRALVAKTVSELGQLDVAFNNAGIHHLGPMLAETDTADWDRVHNVCLKGLFFCLKYELPEMVARGGGAIVNTSSLGGIRGARGVSAYIAAKHGVVGLTRAAALEYAPQGVRVNALCPAATETPMLADWLVNEDAREAIRQSHPIGRWAAPTEMAQAVLFLASSAASFITGLALPVDGGISAQ